MKRTVILGSLALLLLLTERSFAFGVSPSRSEMLLPTNDTVTLVVDNPSNDLVGAKIEVTTREYDQDGVETNRPTDLFKVYPPMLVVPGKTTKAFRVKYVGPKDPKKAGSYRISVEEVKGELQAQKIGRVGMQIDYIRTNRSNLFVVPKDAKSVLQLDKIQRHGNKYEISFKSIGTGFFYATDCSIVLVGPKTRIKLKTLELDALSVPFTGDETRRIKIQLADSSQVITAAEIKCEK